MWNAEESVAGVGAHQRILDRNAGFDQVRLNAIGSVAHNRHVLNGSGCRPHGAAHCGFEKELDPRAGIGVKNSVADSEVGNRLVAVVGFEVDSRLRKTAAASADDHRVVDQQAVDADHTDAVAVGVLMNVSLMVTFWEGVLRDS